MDRWEAGLELYDVLVVGGGHAGAQVAVALRQRQYAGSIAIVGDEPNLPYERPPLSKEYLSGEKSFERLLIRPASFWQERSIDLLLGRRVIELQIETKTALTYDGGKIGYRHLVWAAGGQARRLACVGHDLCGIHTVRTRADVDRMSNELVLAERIVVIGGGYIGLEAAAVLIKLGKRVTVIEAQDRVLARVSGTALSRFYEEQHRERGVELLLDSAVASIEGRDGQVTGVRLADGRFVPAEMIVVGIGIVPSVAPLIAAGALGDNGVAVDEVCRSSIPDVFAIGDCALHASIFSEHQPIRIESVQNANDMAITVAKALTGLDEPYRAVPWFWSHQYDLKLQTVGLSTGHDEVILRGDPATQSFSLVYLKRRRVVALDCVNATRDYVQGRALVLAGTVVEPTELADVGTSLKSLVGA